MALDDCDSSRTLSWLAFHSTSASIISINEHFFSFPTTAKGSGDHNKTKGAEADDKQISIYFYFPPSSDRSFRFCCMGSVSGSFVRLICVRCGTLGLRQIAIDFVPFFLLSFCQAGLDVKALRAQFKLFSFLLRLSPPSPALPTKHDKMR
jgi:hypothetical protein